MKSVFWKSILVIVILVLIYLGYIWLIKEDSESVVVPEVSYDLVDEYRESLTISDAREDAAQEDVETDSLVEAEDQEIIEENEEDISVDDDLNIPLEFNLAVPFSSQAPHGNWDLPYQEACEEASAMMVNEYYQGTVGAINPDSADAELLKLVEFEEDFFGYYLDTTAQETAQMIDLYYGFAARVVENPTVDQIKEQIAKGRPVIGFFAGQELGNPYFSGDGPLYHVLVIKGYSENHFITNDPGTRHGQSFVYEIDTIMNALGDWNDGDPANGAKRVIFTAP